MDHVIPETLGGTDHPDNLVAACSDCNGGKSSSFAGALPDVDQDTLRWAEAIRAVSDELAHQKWTTDALTETALEGLTDDDRQRFLDTNYLDHDMTPRSPERQAFGAALEAISELREGHLMLNASVDDLLDTLDETERAKLDTAFADYCQREQDEPPYDISWQRYELSVALDSGYMLVPRPGADDAEPATDVAERSVHNGRSPFPVPTMAELSRGVLELLDDELSTVVFTVTAAVNDPPLPEGVHLATAAHFAAGLALRQMRNLRVVVQDLLGHVSAAVLDAAEADVAAEAAADAAEWPGPAPADEVTRLLTLAQAVRVRLNTSAIPNQRKDVDG